MRWGEWGEGRIACYDRYHGQFVLMGLALAWFLGVPTKYSQLRSKE